MSGWGSDDDEGPDPEYGVFGDDNPTPIRPRDPREIARAEAWRKRRDNERQVSSGFNSHMIGLFNSARRKGDA